MAIDCDKTLLHKTDVFELVKKIRARSMKDKVETNCSKRIVDIIKPMRINTEISYTSKNVRLYNRSLSKEKGMKNHILFEQIFYKQLKI